MDANAAFVSYSRKDLEFVQKLVKDLKAGGATVWLDKADIEAGIPWDRAVQQALTSCQQMLLVLSPTSAASDNVLDEISVALRTKKTILPILYQECEVPIRVSRLQYIDFRSDYPEALADLLRQLKVHQATIAAAPVEIAAPAPSPVPAGHPSDAPSGKKKSRRWMWITAAAAVVLIWTVYRILSGPDPHNTPNKDATSTAPPTAAQVADKPASNTATGVDLKLRALLGASADDAKAYLGPPDQGNKEDGNKVLLIYWSRALTVELDSPHGRVDSLCFEQPVGDYSGSSGEPVEHVSPGMTRSAIKSVLGSPTQWGKGYSYFDATGLNGQTLEVEWAPGDASDPIAQRVCINQD